jgi:D-tyrosyl-tRNA(Tyr) deacylase
MRAIVQRVTSAAVSVGSDVVASLALGGSRQGLVVLVGVTHTDTDEVADALASKVWRMRILEGDRSAADVSAPILVVSQFTLYANTAKGRRPSWNQAAPAHIAEPLVERVAATLRASGAEVQTGMFGADMAVALVNDGPMTITLDI